MSTKFKKWLSVLLIIGALFFGVNKYVTWLESMIVPFDSQVDLTKDKLSQSYNVKGFYSDSYTLGFAFVLPADVEKLSWREVERKIKDDFNVKLEILMKDSAGNEMVKYVGSLSELTLSKISASPQTKEFLYLQQQLSAKLDESYELTINVIEGSPKVSNYQPHLVFHGIDDGYFWMVRSIYNILLGGLFLIIYAIYFLVDWLTKQKTEGLTKVST